MFSVVIPVYNGEEFISRSIRSVLNQSIQDFEILVVNDGSTDLTSKVVSSFNSDKIILLEQNNRGVSAARNLGIMNSNGSYICFLDADDEWHENHLEIIDEMIKMFPNEVFFTTCSETKSLDGKTVSESGNLPNDYLVIKDCFDYELSKKPKIGRNTDTVCIRKDAFNNWGYFEEGVSQAEDIDMWYRILARNNMIVSPSITVTRNRDFSRATKVEVLNLRYLFIDREEDFLSDPLIDELKKRNISALIDRYRLTVARNMLKLGRRYECERMLKTIRNSRFFLFDYLLTRLCVYMPFRFLQLFLGYDKKQYIVNE